MEVSENNATQYTTRRDSPPSCIQRLRKAYLTLAFAVTSVVCFLLLRTHSLARWPAMHQLAGTHSVTVPASNTSLTQTTTTRATHEWNATVHPACLPRLFQPVPACYVGHGKESGSRPPVHHVFFLKTHKTGSTTVTSILNRYALTYNLTVAIRKNLRGHDASNHNDWVRDYLPVPHGLTHFDLLTDHVRFCEQCVYRLLPKDATFVSIVREPLEAFVSAFYYYRDVWGSRNLEAVPGPNPISTFLSEMDRWDTKPGTPTHSQMVQDFGLQFSELHEPQYLNASLHRLSHAFHLVLLTELFDESMVLLKRYLAWELRDVLYVRTNVGPRHRPVQITDGQREEFERRRRSELALYRFFRDLFHQKMASEDASFHKEVGAFKRMRNTVEAYCASSSAPGRAELIVNATQFSEAFRVGHDDCLLLMRTSSSVKDLWFETLMLERLKAFD